MQEEVKRIQSVPLVIGQFLEMVDAHSGIVGSTTGSNYYVRILSTLNRELLKPSASVALHRCGKVLECLETGLVIGLAACRGLGWHIVLYKATIGKAIIQVLPR